jgi:superfamily II DNA or RNA helicase
VGAGKTLSAILASRVANNGENKMTVVVCLNDIVDQWEKDIWRAFPDSNVIKGIDAFDAKRDENKRQYLILNYEKFSQDNSSNLSLKLGKQKIDFVIIDEIHYVKVRGDS